MKPQVILVHGTFASDEADDGQAWWQRGSDFWIDLQKNLQDEAELVKDRPLFRWTDDSNSDVSRRNAALDLLAYLEPFESSETPYHLIGHSHGGSVIWEALKLSFGSRKRVNLGRLSAATPPLRYLKSWSTVATPFLHKTLNRFRWLVSGVMTFVALFVSGLILLASILMFVAEFIGYKELALSIAAAWLVYVVFAGFVTSYDDGRALRHEEGLRDAVFKVYGEKWFGIWSLDDEAINGLMQASKLDVTVISTKVRSRSPFESRIWWMIVWPALQIKRLALVLLGPIADGVVSRLLRNNALGDDRPGPKSIAVFAIPFTADKADELALGKSLSEKLVSMSNATILPLFRKLLREFATSPDGDIENVAARLDMAPSMLVHTAYFEEPEIRKLLLSHIALTQPSELLLGSLPQNEINQVREFGAKVEQKRKAQVQEPQGKVRKLLFSVPSWVYLLIGGLGGYWFAADTINSVVDAIVSSVMTGIAN